MMLQMHLISVAKQPGSLTEEKQQSGKAEYSSEGHLQERVCMGC